LREKFSLQFWLLLVFTITSAPLFVAYSSGTPDSDGDGIPDNLDSCPNQPETYNGILDLDGCPDDYIPRIDSDQDGLPDAIDACPAEPETYNKYQDEDGCPDTVTSAASSYQFPDVDGDGIDDRWDQCLDQAENYNNYLDWDGCPDQIPG